MPASRNQSKCTERERYLSDLIRGEIPFYFCISSTSQRDGWLQRDSRATSVPPARASDGQYFYFIGHFRTLRIFIKLRRLKEKENKWWKANYWRSNDGAIRKSGHVTARAQHYNKTQHKTRVWINVQFISHKCLANVLAAGKRYESRYSSFREGIKLRFMHLFTFDKAI